MSVDLRCLVADDNLFNRNVAAVLLTMGHQVCGQAENGAEAVALFEEAQRSDQPLELILMDVSMPEMDGLQATQRIRQIEDEYAKRAQIAVKSVPPRVRILAATAHVASDEQDNCLQKGMDAYVTKPLSTQTLQGVLVGLSGAERGLVGPSSSASGA